MGGLVLQRIDAGIRSLGSGDELSGEITVRAVVFISSIVHIARHREEHVALFFTGQILEDDRRVLRNSTFNGSKFQHTVSHSTGVGFDAIGARVGLFKCHRAIERSVAGCRVDTHGQKRNLFNYPVITGLVGCITTIPCCAITIDVTFITTFHRGDGIRSVVSTTSKSSHITCMTHICQSTVIPANVLSFHVCHEFVVSGQIEDGLTTIVIGITTLQFITGFVRAQTFIVVFHTLETIELTGSRLVHSVTCQG